MLKALTKRLRFFASVGFGEAATRRPTTWPVSALGRLPSPAGAQKPHKIRSTVRI